MASKIIFALFIALVLAACIYIERLKNHYSSELTNKQAQFNILRMWVSDFFRHLSKEQQELARKELAEIIIDNENYTIVKEWYKFFFNESSKSK